MSDFQNRYGPVALVTGASSGIGWALAERLAEAGLDLILVARRVQRLEFLAAQLADRHGISARPLAVDLARPDAPHAILQATADLDIGLVVSNAGFGMKGSHADNDPTVMAEMLMVNCHVPMQLTQGFIPRMLARGRGGMILTSSVEGLIGCPYSAAYSATKALVLALGEALWAELQPLGIDILTLCPGATESEAAARSGVELSSLQHVMSADAVARLALEHLADGPTFISSDHYRATFDHLLGLPKRDALQAMAQGMKPRTLVPEKANTP
jgi:short-subunit dehydrogenase